MLCVALLGGALLAALPTEEFTLAWTHSVERTEWRERYRIADGALALTEARIRGSGAGMEVPAGARAEGGWWIYRPALTPVRRLVLANSAFAGDYRLCAGPVCWPLSAWAPRGDPVVLAPCAEG